MPLNTEKAAAELAFWESRIRVQGLLTNNHVEYLYTTSFGLDLSFYDGKRILDIGCGPRGSLEWANGATLRIGVDPLAEAYRKLGTEQHAMQYVACGAEDLPFHDGAFDVVCSFNSLDHVDDLDRVIAEIIRVLAEDGTFLLITEIHRNPTVMEPCAFSWNIVNRFQQDLTVIDERHAELSVFSLEGFVDLYQSIRCGIPFDHSDARERNGILAVRFRKQIWKGSGQSCVRE